MLGQQPRVIRAGCLIDGSGQPAVRNAAVVIEDGVITFVGPDDSPEVPVVPDEQQLDARDGTVLPGIIDTHVHLTFNTRKAAAVPEIIEQTQTDDLTLLGGRVIQAAQAALSGGTTTLRDCGAPGFVTLRIRDLIASRFISGPRLLASGMPITTTGGHLWWCGLEADSRDDVIRATRMLIREGVDFIKIMATGGGMTVGTNTAQPQYDAEQLAAIVREARRLGPPSEAGRSGRLTTAHSHCAAGHLNCMAAGVDMIEHCSWNTPEGGTRFEPEVAKQFVDHGTYISITIGNTARGITPGTPESDLPARLREQCEIVRQKHDLGVRIVFNSDASAPIKQVEEFPRTVAVVTAHAGLSPEMAVHTITGRSAAAIGLDGLIGLLAPGHLADVLVVDGDVSADVAALSNTRWVLRDGVILSDGHGVLATRTTLNPGW